MTAPSALVVTHRARDHVGACLDSLRAEARGLELETLVYDNASDDGTPELVRDRFPWARVLESRENRGFGAAVNAAVRETAGPRLLLLNPDVTLQSGSLSALLDALEKDPTSALVAPQLLNPDGSLQPSAWAAPGLASLAFDALLLRNLFPRSRLDHVELPEGCGPAEVDCLSGACLLLRRDAFLGLGGFDERFFLYYEDFDLCLRARAAGHRACLVPQARGVHVLGGSAFQDRRAFLDSYYASRGAFIAKHHPGPKGRLMASTSLLGVAVRALAYGVAGWLGGNPARRHDAREHALLLCRLLGLTGASGRC